MLKQVFLLAHPAAHSLSPIMHNAAFADLGIQAHYEALDVPPETLEQHIEMLRKPEVLGCNVTIPHKLAVIPLLDALTDEARHIGAVNTIINQEGRLLGHNTDAIGYILALQDDAGFSVAAKQVVILGAGGASRAIAYALLKAGVKSLQIYNRTAAKVTVFIEDFSAYGVIERLLPEQLEQAVLTADLVINTTSLGMLKHGADPEQSPLAGIGLPWAGFVSDIIYNPFETKLLRDAKEAGLQIQNGLPMLVYQGLASFECWTGKRPSAKVMKEALLEHLKSS